jgi:uncharacterized membrane protein
MHYLAGTMDYRIHYSGYPAILERYSDANWISDVDELYVTSGYVFTLGGASISWRSCKQITSNPGDDHWHALERVMHYLAGTMDYGIHYSGYPAVLEGYSDANLISDVDELYAISGYVFTLSDVAVSWRSCKQTILMRSTMETELAALDIAIVKAD